MKKLRKYKNKLLALINILTSDEFILFSFDYKNRSRKYDYYYTATFDIGQDFYGAVYGGLIQYLDEHFDKKQMAANEDFIRSLKK